MACKIFDPYPKDSRENFYDRENIIDEVEKLVSGKFWPLLIGPKRVGKTSIVKIVTKELNGIYIDASGISSLKELVNQISSQVLIKFQIDLKFVKIEGEKSPSQALQKALSKLGNIIIGIDEVQNIITPWFIRVLSVAYNTTDIRFVFTGSMIGMAKILTGEGKGEKFSYQFKGRPIIEIEIKPFTFEESVNFLKYGKDTCNINMSEEEIIDASNTYRGIIGWLTYYGNLRSLGYTHRRAQDEVTKIARTIILSEFSSLSEIQQVIIKALSIMKQARWRDLKKVSEGFLRRDIKDWTFNHALKQLINARIVLKENEKYSLIDPLYSIVQ